MENKQTAVEWIVSKLSITFQTMYIEEIEQAKQMEEDKIREAYYRGVRDEMQNIGKDFEDYYKETYGKE
jgi:hypothetical protein